MEENIEKDIQKLDEEASIENLAIMKLENEKLKQEIERLRKENISLQEYEDQSDQKDQEIKLLKLEIDELRKEKKELLDLSNGMVPKSEFNSTSNPLNTALCSSLVDKSTIKSKEVELVMKSIDRSDFCPNNAFYDGAQTIGFNTTISAPHMHASQLEYLKDSLKNAKKALDIGTGSGMFALCMAKLMRTEGAVVYAVDHIKKILELAKTNISKNHKDFIDSGRIKFVHADGRNGVPDYGPYDVIFLGAAIEDIPDPIMEQLAMGGTLIAPVGFHEQYLTIYHKTANGILTKPIVRVMFGKLQNAKDQYPFDEE